MPVLKPLTANEFTVKDSFHFLKFFSFLFILSICFIVRQQTYFFMGRLDVDSLFTDIPLDRTTGFGTSILKNVEGLT